MHAVPRCRLARVDYFAGAIALALALHTVAAHAAERPNILFVLVDDQSPFSLKTYGNSVCETPNLDRLSAEGMTLDSAYHMGAWSGAVCTPSRTMMMTGRSVWRIPGNGNPNQGDPILVPADIVENSLPAVFNRAGYDTFRTCKRGNSYEAANALFKTRHDKTMRSGNDTEGSQWHGDRVVDYLTGREASENQDPFFIFMGFSHPHDPRHGTPALLKKYGAVDEIDPDAAVNPAAPPLPENYLPAHPFHHGHPKLRDEEQVQGVMQSRTEAVVRNEIGREYACIENIDIQIGRVLEKLEAMGELDNTYVFFTSDHGIAVGRHGLMGKQNLYEHTWRVPFIVKGPGIKAGSRAKGNIYLMDVLPTFCDVAGIEIPKTVDGLTFMPVLEGREQTVRDVLYGVYAGGTKPGMRCVKKGNWKLIKYDVLDGQVRETQLFNLEENPGEFIKEHHDAQVIALTQHTPEPQQVNLADDPAYADKRRELEALLIEEQKRLNDPFRLWDQE